MKKLMVTCLLVLMASLSVNAQEEALITPHDSIPSLLERLFPQVKREYLHI